MTPLLIMGLQVQPTASTATAMISQAAILMGSVLNAITRQIGMMRRSITIVSATTARPVTVVMHLTITTVDNALPATTHLAGEAQASITMQLARRTASLAILDQTITLEGSALNAITRQIGMMPLLTITM
jgi:hypothetical protein